MKRRKRQHKRRADKQWEKILVSNFIENKTLLGRDVKWLRKGKDIKVRQVIRDVKGIMLKNEEEGNNGCKGYFEGLLNVRDDREV